MANVSENAVSIKVAVTGAQALVSHFRRSSEAMERFNKQLQSGSSALSHWAQIGAAVFSGAALSRFFKAAQESSVAVTQLGRSLISTGQSANATTAEFIEQAQALQRLTGVSDESVLAVQRILLSFGAQADVVKRLTPLVLDLAAAMGTDATTAAKQVARALDGEEIKLDRINIRARNTTELMQKMQAAFGGQAAAEFGAKGGLARLVVSLGELEESFGRLLTGGTERFWQRLADGIDRASAAIDEFSAKHPNVIRFFNDLGGAVGEAVGNNLGKVAVGLSAIGAAMLGPAIARGIRFIIDPLRALFVLVTGTNFANAITQGRIFWKAVVTDGTAAIRVFMGPGTRLITIVGALSTAFLGLGAAIAGWEIGKFLNQVTVAGETIETHLTRAVLYLKLEWLEFLTWFVPPGWLGGEWGRELSDQINTARQALADFQEEAKDRPEDNLFEEVSGGGGLSTPESVTRAERLEMEREWAEAELRFAETDERRNFVLQRQLSIAMELEEVRREEFNLAEAKGVADQDALKAEKALLTARTQRREIEKEIQKIYEDQAKERRRQFESTYPGGTQAQFDEFRARAALEAQMGGGRLGIVAGIQEAMMQLGTSAQIVGRAMSTFIGGAVDSIAGGIRGLLSMTMTWGQALRSIASGILNSVVDAIARMFAEWIVGRLLVSSVEKTAAAGELAAKAPVALMDSISSWGVAAAVGIAGLLAAMAALGSFESGGFTGAGPRKAPAGVVHRGEYVVPASSVSRLGLDWFEAAAAGMAPSSQGSDPSTGGRTLNQKLNVFLDRRAWIAASRDDIEAIAIDAMSRAGWRTPHA